MKLIIVSGLSGSGKSIALETLEDCGYYCIDNLPVALLDAFVHQSMITNQRLFEKTALGMDARSQSETDTEIAIKTLKIVNKPMNTP